ncbi:hypothetical protein [Flavobacterium chungnamense]|uniref:FUSC family protein n=1 Tax=Flavobacterium chungnamense TaxID=706182 RepID=A0ABP7V4X3_9FLAO
MPYIFILFLGGQQKIGNLVKGYMIVLGVVLVCTTMDYILVGLKYIALAMVILSSLLVMLYVLSVRYQQNNYLGRISSNIIYFILNTKVTRAKDLLRNNSQHSAVCDEIMALFKAVRPNDAKFTYTRELERIRCLLQQFKLDFDEVDEVLTSFKNWFSEVEAYYIESYSKEQDVSELIDSVYYNLN